MTSAAGTPLQITALALLDLLTWMSPSFPIGAFSYSHSCEAAVEEELVRDRASACAYLEDIAAHGALRADLAVLRLAFAAAWAGDHAEVTRLAAIANAAAPTSELMLETTAQGRAFYQMASKMMDGSGTPPATLPAPDPLPYPVAVALIAARQSADIPLEPLALAYAHGFIANLISALVRIVPLGQSDGLALTAALAPRLAALAAEVETFSEDDIATAVPLADWCSMRHETHHTRLFRS